MSTTNTTTKHCYGWKRDALDRRDIPYTIPLHLASALPAHVDNRIHCPPVYDQGPLGSCTANAGDGMFQYDAMAQREPPLTPSRLFLYFNARKLEGTTRSDAGATIRDTIKATNQWGVCPEAAWPYDVKKFAVTPPASAYAAAVGHKSLLYRRVAQNLTDMRTVLAAGDTFIGGLSIYESFESAAVAKSGVVPMPRPSEQLLGGHALMFVGYDDAGKRFIGRNSWGSSWGQAGYFTIPYAYLLDGSLAADFWTITRVS